MRILVSFMLVSNLEERKISLELSVLVMSCLSSRRRFVRQQLIILATILLPTIGLNQSLMVLCFLVLMMRRIEV
jgi:hypothetical protein